MENTEEFKKNRKWRTIYINPIFIGKWETNFKGLLTENRERYLREQEIVLGLNEVGIDKINLDIETIKTTFKFIKSNT